MGKEGGVGGVECNDVCVLNAPTDHFEEERGIILWKSILDPK